MKKRVIKVVVFFTVFAVLNQIFGFVLGQGVGFSEAMWDEYYETEDLDTIYIGASVAQCAFNPMIIDEVLGSNSFNMATPAQTLDSTYLAVKTATEEHDMKRVVMGFGYFMLLDSRSLESDVTFRKAMMQNQSPLQKAKGTLEFVLNEENIGDSVSLNFICPWIYNHVKLEGNRIVANVQNKWKTLQAEEAVRPADKQIAYVGRGFAQYLPTIDYSKVGDVNTKSYYQPEIFADSVNKLREICALCEEKDIEFIVVNTPRPNFDLVSYGEEYYTLYLWAKDFFAENGAQYYDFNLAKPEVFESEPDYFFNFEHLNYIGAEVFSKDFAIFMERLEQGENVEDEFYNWQEYIELVDFIYE